MEKELNNKEVRSKVVDYTLNCLFMGTIKGIVVGYPIRIIFRSPSLGYFIIAYSMGISLAKANNFLIENVKDV